jgi:hypothetical protein
VSIYKNLFRYRPREKKLSLEDFLSAALSDILNRLPREESIHFISHVLLEHSANIDEWLSFIASIPDASFDWQTQVHVHHVSDGILDVLLRIDGRDVIIIENKIAAPTGSRGADSSLQSVEPILTSTVTADEYNQLHVYGGWLKKRCEGQAWRGALVFLTHFTQPPSDFRESAGQYGVPTLGVCRWGKIWRWAKSVGGLAKPGAMERPVWKELCVELAEFLEERNMTSEYMTSHDVAAVEIFVNSGTRIDKTFEKASEAIETAKTGIIKEGLEIYSALQRHVYDGNGAVAWKYFYVRKQREKTPKNWYFGWGIRFPAISQWWKDSKPELPALPHAFVVLGSDLFDLPLSVLKSDEFPPGWTSSDAEKSLAIAKPLYAFEHDAEQFATDFGCWVANEIQSAIPVLTKLIRALG